MLTLYFAATFLGAATLTILLVLYLGRRDTFLRSMILSMIFCIAMIMIDALLFQPYGFETEESAAATITALLFDIAFYLFMFFWILTMSSINGEKNLIPPKMLPFVFIACFAVYEISLFCGAYDISLTATLIFDAIMVINGIYFIICGIRNKDRHYGRRVLIASGAGLAAYGAWLVYLDRMAHKELTGGTVTVWPHDLIVFLILAFEVIVLVYFFYVDPLGIKKKDKPESADTGLWKEYDLTEREEEIARLILQGLSNPQIAEKAFIAETTVKKHLTNIYKKTETQSRYDLIVKLENK